MFTASREKKERGFTRMLASEYFQKIDLNAETLKTSLEKEIQLPFSMVRSTKT